MKLLTCDHCNLSIEEKELTLIGDIPFHKSCYNDSDLAKSLEDYFNEETERKDLLGMQGTN